MINENPAGYVSPAQREVLIGLCEEPRIENGFFLTGGTALAVFYLGHRVSEDLDLFTTGKAETADIAGIAFWIARRWPGRSSAGRRSPTYAAVDVLGVKVDLVSDPLSEEGERPRHRFENGTALAVDTISNIASNKLATLVSRVEAKNFVDFYFLSKAFPEIGWDEILAAARRKEALFDDPPSAAFQVEEGFRMAISAGASAGGKRGSHGAGGFVPGLLRPLDEGDFSRFYRDLIARLYRLE